MVTGPVITILMNKGISARWILVTFSYLQLNKNIFFLRARVSYCTTIIPPLQIVSGLVAAVGGIMTAFVEVSVIVERHRRSQRILEIYLN